MANTIKQINVGGTAYDLVAKALLDTAGAEHSYEDIVALINKGLEIVIDSKHATKDEPATAASANTMGKLYLVQLADQTTSGTYTEFITLESATKTYSWEKIGTTAADLSGYVKVGTYTTSGPSSNQTSSDGAQTASGTATVTYKKADAATGSAGSTATANSGNAGGVTIQGSNFGFSGTKATLSASTSYTPEGTISNISASAHSHDVNAATTNITAVTGVAADGTVDVVTGVAANGSDTAVKSITTTAATKKGVKVTTTAVTGADKGTVGITGGVASGTTTAITGIPNFNGGSASGTFVTGVKTAGSASIAGYTATATGRVQYVDSITEGSATGSFNTDAIKSISGTRNYGFAASQATIATTIKTNNYGFAASTSDVMYAPTVSNGVLSWSTKAAGTAVAMNSVAASTRDAHTGDAATKGDVSYTAPSVTTKYMGISHSDPAFNTGSVAWTAASLGDLSTATVVTGVTAAALTGTTTFVTNAIKDAALAEDTANTPTFAFNTDAIKSATAGSTFTALKGIKASGTATVIKSTGLSVATTTVMTGATLGTNGGINITPTFTGKTATISVSTEYTPAGSITGSQTVSAHSHTYVSLPAHTHSIGLTDTTITGTAAVAVSNHTHTLGNHTHSITLTNS